MKKKIISALLSLLFVFALWAQNPTADFPYYYYNSYERSYDDYNLGSFIKTLEDNDEWTVKLYRSGNTHYIVTKYKYGKDESESELRSVLRKHKSVYKELDRKIDNDKGTNYNVCLIFIDCWENLICSAQYSENY